MGYIFYNTKQGALKLDVWFQQNVGILELAPLLPNVKIPRGPIPQGTKLFDWENKYVFTLNSGEALALLSYINRKQNEYLNFLHSPSKNKITNLSVIFQNKYLVLTFKESVNQVKRYHSISLCNYSTDAQIDVFKYFLMFVGRLPFIEKQQPTKNVNKNNQQKY